MEPPPRKKAHSRYFSLVFFLRLASLVRTKLEPSSGVTLHTTLVSPVFVFLFFLRLASRVGRKVEFSWGMTPQTPLVSLRSGRRISVLDARFARCKESRAFLGVTPHTPLVSLRSGPRRARAIGRSVNSLIVEDLLT